MTNLTNKDIIKEYKKKSKRRDLVKTVLQNYYNKYEVYLFITGILLLYCAPTIAFGITNGKSIFKIIISSLLIIIVSLGLNFIAVLPWLRSDNNQMAPSYVILILMLACSYSLQIAINII